MSTPTAEEVPCVMPAHLELPPAPAAERGAVKAWAEPVPMRSYMPEAAELHPMFLDRRVYQGSSGRVYPLPFIDRIATEPSERNWQAIHIENEHVRLMILPEIGGRIHIGYDKAADFDFFYRQNVIKPALVGLAGPWISGGVEFNWPQHHRPATFMPVATEIERHDDGSVTVWCSDHDPMQRMKGMHGVCLHPGKSLVELKVRLYNRTPYTQSFLWWANVATRVHERYQSFFPTDMRFVADHARRAVTSLPAQPWHLLRHRLRRARTQRRPAGGAAPELRACWQLSPQRPWAGIANIPVPTSYMVTGTREDFFGGYDHKAGAGVVHVANHHIAPGKKQWTWGNHDFGYAWDRNLTDTDGPYIELMAGVYTDNQPDFSWLAPWETKTFSQFWYPLHGVGVPQAANTRAALHLSVAGGKARVGLDVTENFDAVDLIVHAGAEVLQRWRQPARIAHPLLLTAEFPPGAAEAGISVRVLDSLGRELIAYSPAAVVPAQPPSVATEPAAPDDVASVEELYLAGLHLAQYRHATRRPELYWTEALRRDPGDSRCHTAMASWHLRRGEMESAASHAEAARARLTERNGNPAEGEPLYLLGLVRRLQGQPEAAYDAFYKATWNAAWRAPAYLALAEIDMAAERWPTALDHLERSLTAEAENLLALAWRVVVLRRLERDTLADQSLAALRRLDPLDITSRWLAGSPPANPQERLDLAFDLRRAGLTAEAYDLLSDADLGARDGTAPIAFLLRASLAEDLGSPAEAATHRSAAVSVPLDYCFPNRLEEYLVLKQITQSEPGLAVPWYLLGLFLYDRGRHDEAMHAWETAAQLGLPSPTLHRNLGIGLYNVRRDARAAQTAFEQSFALNPDDARVLYEKDQLAKRIGDSPEARLNELSRHRHLVERRDDLSVELATLLNQTGQPERALGILLSRRFQPWEGGEGHVLGQFVRARLLLGQAALQDKAPECARQHFAAALDPPASLSEARHLLANASDIHFWIGEAEQALGDADAAQAARERAVRQRGDFQEMAVRSVSELTFWSALALRRLGRETEAEDLLRSILAYAEELEHTEPRIDYFATSLPAMLLFEDDLRLRSRVSALFLRAQALSGLGEPTRAQHVLEEVLRLDSNHAGAGDFLRLLRAPAGVIL